jgi:DNA-binding NarL/FixJ family response regulator
MGVIYETLAQLLNSRSDQQDRHLRDKLSELQQDVVTLIAQGKTSPKAPSG